MTVHTMDQGQAERGIIVRYDEGPPYQTIIRLQSGRYVLGTECQYRIVKKSPPKVEIAELHGGPYDGHQVGMVTDGTVLAIPDLECPDCVHCYQRAPGRPGLQYLGLRADERT